MEWSCSSIRAVLLVMAVLTLFILKGIDLVQKQKQTMMKKGERKMSEKKELEKVEVGMVRVENTGLATNALSIEDVAHQIEIIQKVMKTLMKEGVHFGCIPGTDKPTLYQAGADKLAMVFRLRPDYDIKESELENGHREYIVECSLYHIPTGTQAGKGLGSATTLESKHRYRYVRKASNREVPTEYWKLKKQGKMDEAQKLIGGRSVVKKDGKYYIAEDEEKGENENLADVYNTVLKMACKRAYVAAVRTTTAASDIFSQDLEDIEENLEAYEKAKGKDTPKKELPPMPQPEKPANAASQKPTQTAPSKEKEVSEESSPNVEPQGNTPAMNSQKIRFIHEIRKLGISEEDMKTLLQSYGVTNLEEIAEDDMKKFYLTAKKNFHKEVQYETPNIPF